MHAPTVSFLGLIGSFDRASVAEASRTPCDTGPITSSFAQRPCGIHSPVLYSPPGSRRANASNPRPSTKCTNRFH